MVKEFPELQDNVDAIKVNNKFISNDDYKIIEQKFTEKKHEKEIKKVLTDPNTTNYKIFPQ
jgi:hypothetical protein